MTRTSAVVVLLCAAGAAQADVVAYWAFPTTAPTQNFNIAWPIPADLRANLAPATIDTDAPKYDGSPAPTALQQGSMQYFAGSVVNVQPSFVAGQGLSMRNDSLDRGQNKSIIVHFDASTFVDLVLSYAERYSNTGPTGVTVQYSTDGVSYTTFTSYTTTRDGAFASTPRVVDMSSVVDIENAADVYLKIMFTGFNVNTAGTARLDNVTITATPTPGALALLGLGGLVAARRRR